MVASPKTVLVSAFPGHCTMKKKIKPRWIKLLNSCFTLVHMKVEQSESRKLLLCRVEKKWLGKMTFSDSLSWCGKAASSELPGLFWVQEGMFANSRCLQVAECACMYTVYLYKLWCCSLLLLKSCCEVCHHWEAGWFVCLPQLFFPCCIYFKVLPVTGRRAFCSPCRAEVSQVF